MGEATYSAKNGTYTSIPQVSYLILQGFQSKLKFFFSSSNFVCRRKWEELFPAQKTRTGTSMMNVGVATNVFITLKLMTRTPKSSSALSETLLHLQKKFIALPTWTSLFLTPLPAPWVCFRNSSHTILTRFPTKFFFRLQLDKTVSSYCPSEFDGTNDSGFLSGSDRSDEIVASSKYTIVESRRLLKLLFRSSCEVCSSQIKQVIEQERGTGAVFSAKLTCEKVWK